MQVSKRIQALADAETRQHPNHIIGSGRKWHWSYYHSGYGMATGWATSERAAERARAVAMARLQERT